LPAPGTACRAPTQKATTRDEECARGGYPANLADLKATAAMATSKVRLPNGDRYDGCVKGIVACGERYDFKDNVG
jgi:hypothetical protein